MERKEFLKLLETGKVPSVLIFEGEETNLMQSALSDLRAALLPPGLEELNESRLENPETDELIAAAETVPFMADRRLVTVRDYPGLVGRGETDDRLIEYLPRVPKETVLLFLCVQSPNKKKKLYTSVGKLGGVVTFSRMNGAELTTFVTNAFKELGRECDERTADFLIFTCGRDTSALLAEISKISARRRDGSPVSPDDVRDLAVPTSESTVFQITDALIAGQDARVFQLVRDQLLRGESEIKILALILRQFRIMQHIRIQLYEKKPDRDVRAMLNTVFHIPPFIAPQYIRQANSWTNRQIKSAVQLCTDTDYAVKSGRMNQEGSLEAVLLKLLLLKKNEIQELQSVF